MRNTNRTRNLSRKYNRTPFVLLVVYLFFEYGRPQSLFRPLSVLHIPAIVAILLAITLIVHRKLSVKEGQSLLFVLLLGLMVVHGPFAVNNYWALMVFIGLGFSFIAYMSIVQFVDNEERFEKLIDVWLKIHVMVAIVGIAKKGVGAGGFLGDENDLCLALNMVLPFPFFLAISKKGKSKRIYYIFLACVFLFVIILTKSRGGFVGLVATGFYCWWKSKRKALSAAVVVVLALFMAAVAPPTYWNEVRSIAEENTPANPFGTGAARIYSWKIGWGMFLDHPIIGVGQGNYPWNVGEYEEKLGYTEGFHERSFAGRQAHSLYFTLLPELGLVGVLLFGGMLFRTVKDLRYVQRVSGPGISVAEGALPAATLATALEASLVGYLASGVFLSVLYYPNFWLLMGFTVSLRKIMENTRQASRQPVTIKGDMMRRDPILGDPSAHDGEASPSK